ncbi:uncharacterized protein [Lepeophtheirus salmonis]|uniref:uncharacterized protein isoform X11 n=1 Tax=Lepeophtheirus salmonis TaxID=72036 RepID=UPI001AEB5800|nr:flocculation protein FLO11-like isoform X4 [Lepeophtheirus salmonis]
MTSVATLLQLRSPNWPILATQKLNKALKILTLRCRSRHASLHSEYRSTYRWHEFTPKQQDVIKKPPQPIKDDISFSRKKKHPDVAYRSHDFFESDLRPTLVPISTSSGGDEADSGRKTRPIRRNNKMFSNGETPSSRRARSEGPIHRIPLLSTVPLKSNNTGSTSGKRDDKKESSHPPAAPSSKWNSTENRHKAMKESLSMGQILSTGNASNQQTASNTKSGEDSFKINGDIKEKSSSDIVPRRNREYRSEYRQCFRPFSQYEYLDGRFIPSPGPSTPPSDSEVDRPNSRKQSKQAALHGEPWYREVVELRKQAMDYKCRGWGTDPNNSKRAELYEQTCKRESLSALSLAIITPRATEPLKKETPKSATSGSSGSPTKHGRLSRPRTAPSTRGSAKSSRSESAHPASDASVIPSSVKSIGDNLESRGAGKSQSPSSNRSKSVGPSRPKVSQRPPSGPPPPPTPSSSVLPDTTTKVHKDLPRRQRPSGNRPGEEVVTSRAISDSGRRPMSRSSSKTSSRPPSAIENNLDYFREPVVKSPPEPTRVKSPELMVRSPDPINWTVPLDTAKTFSVTQSVRDGESARQSPMSDYSSHFDSVSGTAINLGMMSRNERGAVPIHPPKISSLAKEAREPTPGFTKDSTMTRPSGGSAIPPRPLKEPLVPQLVSNTNGSVHEKKEGEEKTFCEPSRLNGSQKEEEEVKECPKDQQKESEQMSHPTSTANQPLSSTGLKCLDDPNFSFESTTNNPSSTETVAIPKPIPPQTKKPAYHVLEDPFESDLLQQAKPAPLPPASSASPYKVLEDPSMSSSVYDPSHSAVKRPIVVAAEVLEGARERFDKFWAKPGDK